MVTRKQVMGSLECQWRLRSILLTVLAWALVAGFGEICIGLSLSRTSVPQFSGIYQTIAGIMLGIPLVYHLVQYILLVTGWHRYELCEAKLEDPVAPVWPMWHVENTLGFEVQLAVQGRYMILKTRRMWMARDHWIYPYYPLSEYNNRKVELLYDSKRERIIVLGFPEIRR